MWQIIKTTNHALFLLDNEYDSPLYCRQSLASLAALGPERQLQIPSPDTPETALCIPRRSDFYAPGFVGYEPEPALCSILASISDDLSDVSQLKEGLCASL